MDEELRREIHEQMAVVMEEAQTLRLEKENEWQEKHGQAYIPIEAVQEFMTTWGRTGMLMISFARSDDNDSPIHCTTVGDTLAERRYLNAMTRNLRAAGLI